MKNNHNHRATVSLLTAGRDRHYALGLATAIAATGIHLDLIGSDELEGSEVRTPPIRFLNLRGDQSVDAGLFRKMCRVCLYYFRLIAYALSARPGIFHILWNNKFEWFDRTILMLFYKSLGKQIVFTAHNVNAGIRDSYDSFLNRLSLKIQYRLCDRIFVHTSRMKDELISAFGVPPKKVVLIPYGINNAVPETSLTPAEARKRLGLRENRKAILFFGNIAPYKGVEFLTDAFGELINDDSDFRLIIAGRPRGPKSYWEQIQNSIRRSRWRDFVIQKIEYISDEETEIYFKAADVLVLPYVHIFQSGVLFLAYRFGLPVIVTDVGSFREEIVEGKTGLVVEPRNARALADAIRRYFESDRFLNLETSRREIQKFAAEKNSWDKVAAITTATYAELLRNEENPGPLLAAEKP